MSSTLHIYAQFTNHDFAFILGDKGGLTRLRNALDSALLDWDKGGNGRDECGTFASDGEGYRILVGVLSEEEAGKLATPYTDTDAPHSGVLSPDAAWGEGLT